MNNRPLIILTGPTAVGKTALSIGLAKAVDGEIISAGSVNFSYPTYFRYADPQLTCRVIGDEIEVTAKAYAKSVEILNENEDLILSDNYFDMNAGTKRVKIESGDVSRLTLRSVYDIK